MYEINLWFHPLQYTICGVYCGIYYIMLWHILHLFQFILIKGYNKGLVNTPTISEIRNTKAPKVSWLIPCQFKKPRVSKEKVTFNVAFVKNCKVYYSKENDDFSPSSNHNGCYECENLLMVHSCIILVPIYINCLEFDLWIWLNPIPWFSQLIFCWELGNPL